MGSVAAPLCCHSSGAPAREDAQQPEVTPCALPDNQSLTLESAPAGRPSLSELEAKKNDAIAKEDYIEAHAIKREIDSLKVTDSRDHAARGLLPAEPVFQPLSTQAEDAVLASVPAELDSPLSISSVFADSVAAESVKQELSMQAVPTLEGRRASLINGLSVMNEAADRVEPSFLATVPVFSRCLSTEDIEMVANAMTLRSFDEGTTFVRKGDEATEFFVIASGMVSVHATAPGCETSMNVATLQKGDIFGESALMTEGRRNASLIADTSVVCFCISKDTMEGLGLAQKLQFEKRRTVGREIQLVKGQSVSSFGTSTSLVSDVCDELVQLVSKAFLKNKNLQHIVNSSGLDFAKEVVKSCMRVEAAQGQVLIHQGDHEANHFFIIEKGRVSVSVGTSKKKGVLNDLQRLSRQLSGGCQEPPEIVSKVLCTLKTGQSFGELALLYTAPRAATVTAVEPTSLLSLDRSTFKDILKKATLNKSASYVKYFAGLETLNYLSAAEKRLAATGFESVHFLQGNTIFQLGDPSTTLYVLLDGKVETRDSKDRKKTMTANISKNVWRYLGQAALISTSARSSTVTVISAKATALMLDRDNLSMLLGHSTTAATGSGDTWLSHISTVQRLHVSSSIGDDVKEALARACKKAMYAQGDTVYRKGDTSSHFYILVSGCVEVLDGKSCHPVEGPMHFGDREVFESSTRRCTVTVASESAHVLRVEADMFLQLMGQFKNKFSAFWEGVEEILKKDLIMDGVIAQGALGPVELCTHRHTGVRYALKTVRKDLIIEKGLKTGVMRERSAWIQLKYPFIVHLHALYNDPQSLHFLSEYVPFGSLGELFHSRCFYSSEAHAKFYIAGVVMALRYFHKKRLVHRDIKPESVLITSSGHPKLYDFALAKAIIGKTFTMCGTPEYMAPEILALTGHTIAVDWWAVGIMTYELMAGATPFVAGDPMEVCANVIRGLDRVNFSPAVSGSVADLVRRMCANDPASRLSGAHMIMRHDWFAGWNWQSMASQSLPAPYRPPQEKGMSAKKSQVRNHGIPASARYKDDGTGWDKGFASQVGLLGTGSESGSTFDLG